MKSLVGHGTMCERKEIKMDKRVNKKTGEELQQYLAWRRKGSKVPAKKGKGSYERKTFKKEGM